MVTCLIHESNWSIIHSRSDSLTRQGNSPANMTATSAYIFNARNRITNISFLYLSGHFSQHDVGIFLMNSNIHLTTRNPWASLAACSHMDGDCGERFRLKLFEVRSLQWPHVCCCACSSNEYQSICAMCLCSEHDLVVIPFTNGVWAVAKEIYMLLIRLYGHGTVTNTLWPLQLCRTRW